MKSPGKGCEGMTNAKILIVQNDDSAAGLEECLHGLGYAVCGPASGRQAIEKAAGMRPDLALIDLGLEGEVNGIEAARQVGSFGVPVIYLTDGAEEHLLQRALATHPFGYVLKTGCGAATAPEHPDRPFHGERESRHRETESRLEQTIDDLRSQAQLMETVFGSMNEGMVVADAEGRILLGNPSAEQITGMEVVEQTGGSRPDEWPETYGVRRILQHPVVFNGMLGAPQCSFYMLRIQQYGPDRAVCFHSQAA